MSEELTQQQQDQLNNVLFRAVTFHLNNQLYACNILQIRDIVIGNKVYRIPNSHDSLVGVTNIRGEILPVYSLKIILGMDEHLPLEKNPVTINFEKDEYLMIIKYETYLFAIIVDYIDKNISVTEENYNEGKYMEKWSQDNIFAGIIIDEQDNILLIDVPALINSISKDHVK